MGSGVGLGSGLGSGLIDKVQDDLSTRLGQVHNHLCQNKKVQVDTQGNKIDTVRGDLSTRLGQGQRRWVRTAACAVVACLSRVCACCDLTHNRNTLCQATAMSATRLAVVYADAAEGHAVVVDVGGGQVSV